MEFTAFLEHILKIRNIELPAESAHLKMAPPERQAIMENEDLTKLNPRKASVLMLVYPSKSQASLALIMRNSYKGVHSSQIAFPGGKKELTDASDAFTALRETEEEVGVASSSVVMVRQFSQVYIPPSNFMVSPFLAYVDQTPQFDPDPREVSAMIELPLAELLNDSNIINQNMATSYSNSIDVPVFRVGEIHIWGATAMMLSELKEVLKAVQ